MKKLLLSLLTTTVLITGCNSGSGATSSNHGLNAASKETTNTVNTISKSANAEPFIMGYYANWDAYKPGHADDYKFSSSTVQAKLSKMNAVAYAFFEVATDGTAHSVDFWSDFTTSDKNFCDSNQKICFGDLPPRDVTGANGNFTAFSKSSIIKHRLVAIGGAGHDNAIENAMNNPQTFANSIVKLKSNFGITGVDLDYEPIGGIPANYKAKFVNLVKVLRNTLGNDFMITYTIIPNQDSINDFGADNWKAIVPNLDYINIMGYDIFGTWEGNTGLQSALYTVTGTGGSSTYSDDTAIKALNNMGINSSKLVLGVPAYGRGAKVSANGLGVTFNNGSFPGDLDDPSCGQNNSCSSTMTYGSLIKNNVFMNDYLGGPDGKTIVGTYSNYNDPLYGNIFASYDSPASVKAKIQYAKTKGLAGMMMWDLNYDAPASDSNSLLATIANEYGYVGPTPTPTPTGVYFILQVSNIGPNVPGQAAYSSASLVVNNSWNLFGTAWRSPISPGANQLWGTTLSAEQSGVTANDKLDEFFADGATSFTTSQIVINGYPSWDSNLDRPSVQYDCTKGRGYTFQAGHSYNLMLNAASQSCEIKQMN